MKKILLSLSMIAVVGVVVLGATGAFFSDTETSTGNTFTAGAIDLKIDNDSYYNGELNQGTTWQVADLNDGYGPADDGLYLFFDFDDLKPGDYGEDTISIHVATNDAYACVDTRLDSDDDNSSTEPELVDETPYTPDDGELAEAIDFLWWVDDGDNVLEEGENTLPSGPLGVLDVGQVNTHTL